MLDLFFDGLSTALEPSNLLFIAAGTSLGVLIGALPGLSSTTGLAILLPFTFVMSPTPAFLMMVSLYMAAEYGGSITAITVGVPGTPPALATTFDGYPLTQKGQVGKALGTSIISSTLGGLLGVAVLVVASGPIASLALRFGPAEYFALGLFGLSIVANMVSEGALKGFISVTLGLLFCVAGVDALTGSPRLTFDVLGLLDGIPLVPALIGLFAVSELLKLVEEGSEVATSSPEVSAALPTIAELWQLSPTILRSGLIGALVGAIPGAGATIASLIAYHEARRVSKTPEAFGTGALEGVAAPEAANNACVGGAMIPLLTLGIPGSASTAILLGGFMVHGMNPGPMLMSEHGELVGSLYGGLALATLFMLAVGLLGIPLWVRILSLRRSTLTPWILGLSVVGAYAVGNSVFDVGVAFAFGVLGYLMRRYGFPLAPMVLAMVLGFLVETNYRRALTLSSGDHTIFFREPGSLVLLGLAALSFLLPLVRARWANRAGESGEGAA